MRNNALWNCKNPFQGKYEKILCVCSAGLLRSPTIAWVLGNNGYNTRAVGIHDYALIPIDPVLVEWADKIVAADTNIKVFLENEYKIKDVINLGIPDQFEFREPKLIKLIEEALHTEELI